MEFSRSIYKEKHRNDMEMDFLISNKSRLNYKVYPIPRQAHHDLADTLQGTFWEQNRRVLCNSSEELVCEGRGDIPTCIYDVLP